jgi:hypothetical protein
MVSLDNEVRFVGPQITDTLSKHGHYKLSHNSSKALTRVCSAQTLGPDDISE